jgi:LacI family transcriptional regulator
MKQLSPTIRDVAAAAGVSTATVSRVLSPDGTKGVSEKTRLRVNRAAARLKYRTNHAARSLKTRLTRTVAIVAPELGNTFFMDLAEGMERELEAHGYTLLIASSANSAEEEKKRVSLLMDHMVDGMAVIPAGFRGDHLGLQDRRGVPIILVDRLVKGADLDAVLSDNEAGARDLTGRLIADGFRRIAFVGGNRAVSVARERLAGFKRALKEAGIPPGPELVFPGGMGVEDGYRRMEEALKTRNPPEALVAVNLQVHLGMQRRLLESADPFSSRKIVLAAFDETVYTPFLPFCRYTAAQDAAGMGKQAVRRILERIELRKKAESADTGIVKENAGKRIIRFPVRIIRH